MNATLGSLLDRTQEHVETTARFCADTGQGVRRSRTAAHLSHCSPHAKPIDASRTLFPGRADEGRFVPDRIFGSFTFPPDTEPAQIIISAMELMKVLENFYRRLEREFSDAEPGKCLKDLCDNQQREVQNLHTVDRLDFSER